MALGVAPGMVLRLYISTLRGGPKDKYCVLACITPKPRLLLISSEPSQLKRDNPDLWGHQVVIDAANHREFLRQDSYIDCSDPYGMSEEEIARQLNDGSNRVLCKISPSVLRNLRAVIKSSNLIPGRQIQWMLDALPDP